jgi:branched-chain amino acid transport system permease protein
MMGAAVRPALALAAGVALFAMVPLFGGDYFIGVVLTLLMWIALTESWVVLSAMTGYVSLGHVVFFGAGAYVMVLTFGVLPFWASVLSSGAVAGALALLVGYPCLRVRGPYFVILTFGLAELVKFIVINVEAALGKFGRLLFGGPSLSELFYAILLLAAASVVITFAVRRSRFGAGLRAIRENEEAAETLGINVAGFKVLAFALSAIIPGMVGSVMVLRTTYFEPLDVFNPITSFTIVSMAIIGGGDDVPGPLYGACFLVLLQELLWANWPEIYMILLGTLLVGFVLGAPSGIQGRLAVLRRGSAR